MSYHCLLLGVLLLLLLALLFHFFKKINPHRCGRTFTKLCFKIKYVPSLHRAFLSGSFSSCSRDSVLFHSEDMIWFKGNHPWLACECAGSYSLCCVLAFVCPGLIIHLIPVLDLTEEEMNMVGINSWQK